MTRIAETCWCGASFEIDIPGVRDVALMHYREWKRHTHRPLEPLAGHQVVSA
jgi:hypothetical protein